MELPPPDADIQPIDLIKQPIDEQKANLSPEEIDALTAQCVGCFALLDSPETFKADAIARCQNITPTQAFSSLDRLATGIRPLVLRQLGGNFAPRFANPDASFPDNCYQTMSEAERAAHVRPSLAQRLEGVTKEPVEKKAEDTHDSKAARKAAIERCITCHAQRAESTQEVIVAANKIAACVGGNRVSVGEIVTELCEAPNPLIAKSAKKRSNVLTARAFEAAADQPVKCFQADEQRQRIVDGLKGCIRCLATSPDVKTGTITVQDIAECRGFTATEVTEVLHEEDLPLVTTRTPGAYRVAPDAIAALRDIKTPRAESSMTCDERFLTWAYEVPKDTPSNIEANVLQALKDGYITIKSFGGREAISIPVHNTGRYLAIGPALEGLREPAQQVVVHILGLDELVYGKRFESDALKRQLGLGTKTSLVTYARFAIQRLQEQRP